MFNLRHTFYIGAAAFVLLAPVTALADSWDGGGANDNISTANNWSPNAVPVNNGTAFLVFQGSVRLTPVVDAPWAIDGLWFGSSSGAFSISGSTLTIGDDGVRNDSTNQTQTFNSNIILSAAQSWSSLGDLRAAGVDNSGFDLTVTGSGATTFNGLSSSGDLLSQASGTVTLSGANTYSGSTFVGSTTTASTLRITGSALSTDFSVSNGSTLQITAAPAADQIGDSRNVTLSRSTLKLTGDPSGQAIESFGDLNIDTYASTVTLDSPGTIAGGVFTPTQHVYLVANNLNRTGHATLLINGVHLGQTDSGLNKNTSLRFINAPSTLAGAGGAPGSQNMSILPWAVGNSAPLETTPEYSLLTNDTTSGLGLRALSNTEYSSLSAAVGSSDRNVRIDTHSNLAVGGQTINSLTLRGTTLSYSLSPADTLNVASGAVMVTSVGATASTSTIGTRLTTTSPELIFHVYNANLNVGRSITGSIDMVKSGPGTMTLQTASDYTGSTTVNGGTLELAFDNLLPTTTFLSVRNATFNLKSRNQSLDRLSVDSGSITGPGTVTVTGSNPTVVSNSTLSNNTLVTGSGILEISKGANLSMVVLNGDIHASVSDTSISFLDLNSATRTLDVDALVRLNLSQVMNSTGGIVKTGDGDLNLAANTNLFSGGITIKAGRLTAYQPSSLGDVSAPLTIEGGTLLAHGVFTLEPARPVRLGPASGSGAGTIFVVDTFNYAGSFTNTGTGTGGLIMLGGNGTMNLSGHSTYTGGTTVAEGTLRLIVTDALAPTGTVTVSGGTLDISSFNQTVGNVTLAGNSFDIGIAGTTGTLFATGYDLQSGTVAAKLGGSGNLNKTTPEFVFMNTQASYTGSTTVTDGTLELLISNALPTSTFLTVQSGSLALGDFSSQSISLSVDRLTVTGTGDVKGFLGTLTVTGASPTVISNDPDHHFSANLTTGTGDLEIGNQVSAGGTTLKLNGNVHYFGIGQPGNISFSTINLNASTRTFNVEGSNTSAGDLLTGKLTNGGIVKTGAGSMRLSSTNTYSGGTTIYQGRLIASGASPLGAAAGFVSIDGGTLMISGNGLNNHTVSVGPSTGSGSGTIEVFASNSAGFTGNITNNASGTGTLIKTGTGTLTLTGHSTYTGGTTVNAGTLNLNVSDALASAGNVTVNNTATLSMNSTQHFANLALNDSVSASLSAGGNKVLVADNLSTSGAAAFDLNDNDAILVHGNLASLTSRLTSGFNNGLWNGAGIRSSTAAADTDMHTALGIADNSALQYSSFSGESLTSGSEILIKFTWYGDADLDGSVTSDDLLLLADHLGQSGYWQDGDFNYDGQITGDDMLLLSDNFGRTPTLSSPTSSDNPSGGGAGPTPLPEPASLLLLAAGSLLTLTRPRRAH